MKQKFKAVNPAQFILFCFLLLGLNSCGYYTTRALSPKAPKAIYIEPFLNKIDVVSENSSSLSQRFRTYHPLMEKDLRSAVINRLVYDGGLRLGDKQAADLILKGELVDYRKDVLRYQNNQEDAAEYRVSIVMGFKLFKKGEENSLWAEPNFTADATYFTSGTQAITEAQALDLAVADLAKRLVERIVEDW